jgi:hypothetical protein
MFVEASIFSFSSRVLEAIFVFVFARGVNLPLGSCLRPPTSMTVEKSAPESASDDVETSANDPLYILCELVM